MRRVPEGGQNGQPAAWQMCQGLQLLVLVSVLVSELEGPWTGQ